MSKTKKPLPVGKTESGRGIQISDQTDSVPAEEYITSGNRSQAVVALLPRGAENAVSTQTLMRMTGCISARQLQERVAAERAQGALILSIATGGYFLPDVGEKGRREMQDYISTLSARAINTLRATKFAKAALAIMEGQQQMDGEECAEE